jgi:hypothetical protein
VHGNGPPALLGCTGLGVAALDEFAGTVFAGAALAGNTQFKLDVIKTLALIGVLSNGFLADTVANTNNHGGEFVLNRTNLILNENLSYLHLWQKNTLQSGAPPGAVA